jgi:hypothetical protein
VYDTLQLHYEQGELAEFAISKRADSAGGNMQDKGANPASLLQLPLQHMDTESARFEVIHHKDA